MSIRTGEERWVVGVKKVVRALDVYGRGRRET